MRALLERAKKTNLGRGEVEPATGTKPHLSVDKEIFCGTLKPTVTVPSGNFRLQCDDPAKVCLAAPNRVLHDGVESEEELQRTAVCSPLSQTQLDRMIADDYRFLEAVPEAPDGWFRDEQGRIVQVNFDLHRRVYFGGTYSPLYAVHGGGQPARGRADFGIEIEIASESTRELHRLHILEGSAWLGPDLRIMATGIRYDWSARRLSAPLWVTTFIGPPHRFDLDVNISGWFESLRFEWVNDKSYLTLLSANAAFDIWHSKDLQSYLRVRFGPAGEMDLNVKALALRTDAAVEGDFTLDADGFHHLTAAVVGEKLFFEPQLAGRHQMPQRLRAQAGYEVILLAINDYPLTFIVDAHAGWRDDLPGVQPGWEFGADAGLRFSFWAPQRRTATQVNHRG